MVIERTLAEAIEDAERTLQTWFRVHKELDEGKPWAEIDNGWRCRATGYGSWCAYMQQRMKNQLYDIILCYRHGPDAGSTDRQSDPK